MNILESQTQSQLNIQKDLLKIQNMMEKGKALFFLGSGFSLNFGVPSWDNFLEKFINDVVSDIELHPGLGQGDSTNSWNLPNLGEKEKKIKTFQSLKEQLKTKAINNDFILELIYKEMGIDIQESSITSQHKHNLVRTIYKEAFHFNKAKIDEKQIDERRLKNLRKIVNKVVTTNYDDLLIYDYNSTKMSKKFNNYPLGEKNHCLDEENIHIPIHGTIRNKGFENDFSYSIWQDFQDENESKLSCRQFGIVDSFSSFQKQYSSANKNSLQRTLENIISQAYENDFIIIFFGYSFNDQFVTKEIIEICQKKVIDNKQFIYIFRDDLENKIMQKLNILDENKIFFHPLLSGISNSVKFIDFSEIIDLNRSGNEKWSKHHEEKIKNLDNKISLLKNCNPFKINGESENLKDILWSWVKKNEDYKKIIGSLYPCILDRLEENFKKNKRENKVFENWISNEFGNTISKKLKDSLFEIYSTKNNNVDMDEWLSEIEKDEDFEIKAFAIILIFSLTIKKNKKFFSIFFKKLNEIKKKQRIPYFWQLLTFNNELEEIKNLLQELKIEGASDWYE